MKHPTSLLLLALLALPACQTTRRAAVSTFRVIDAPHEYMRHQLHLDEHDQQNETTDTTTTTSSTTNVPPNTAQQKVPPTTTQSTNQQRVVTATPPPTTTTTTRHQVQTEPSRESNTQQTTAPVVTSRSTTTASQVTHQTAPSSTPPASTSVAEKTSLPYAKPVPGKAGYVYSPYDKNGGYVDVTGFAPGSKVKDPYSGKVFLVP